MRSGDPDPPADRMDLGPEADAEADADDPGAGEPDPETVELPITDVLDLHSFPPREVPSLVRDWLDEAYAAGFRRLRIVHGRGVGVQRKTVRTILERDPRVVRFGDADPGAGGWGATWVELE